MSPLTELQKHRIKRVNNIIEEINDFTPLKKVLKDYILTNTLTNPDLDTVDELREYLRQWLIEITPERFTQFCIDESFCAWNQINKEKKEEDVNRVCSIQ